MSVRGGVSVAPPRGAGAGAVAGAAPGVGGGFGAAAASEDALDALRVAFVELLSTDRRVRGREGHRSGELSFAHYHVLSCLLDADRLPAGHLAAAADLSPASTTQTLDLLEKRGMVHRERDPHDRRVVVASLTDDGRRLTAERRVAFRGLWEEVLGDLDPDEMAAGVKVLGRIAAFLDELTARKASASAPAA